MNWEKTQVVSKEFAEKLIKLGLVSAIYKHPRSRVVPYTILELYPGCEAENWEDRITVKVEEVLSYPTPLELD